MAQSTRILHTTIQRSESLHHAMPLLTFEYPMPVQLTMISSSPCGLSLNWIPKNVSRSLRKWMLPVNTAAAVSHQPLRRQLPHETSSDILLA